MSASPWSAMTAARGSPIAWRWIGRICVERLALLDIIPTIEEWDSFDKKEALATFHWPFLAQPGGLPERLILAESDLFLRYLMHRWAGDPTRIDSDALAEYLRCFRLDSVIRASCADYRAGATTDSEDDAADRAAGKRIACPLLLLWGAGRGDHPAGLAPLGRRRQGRGDRLRPFPAGGSAGGGARPAAAFSAGGLKVRRRRPPWPRADWPDC